MILQQFRRNRPQFVINLHFKFSEEIQADQGIDGPTLYKSNYFNPCVLNGLTETIDAGKNDPAITRRLLLRMNIHFSNKTRL